MEERDQEGLRLFLKRYGGRLKGFLVKYYADVLQPGELEEALNTAVFNIWRFADRYDEGKGALASWSIRIAQRAAQSIIRREFGYREKNLEYDPSYDPAGDPPAEQEAETRDRSDDPRLKVLHEAIEALPPLQKAIIQADLAAGTGVADAGRLAVIHGTSKNAIYVSRFKARETLRRQAEQYNRRVLSRRSSHGQRG
jgi:RNA polymerase sigma factor (sigma-70 family)